METIDPNRMDYEAILKYQREFQNSEERFPSLYIADKPLSDKEKLLFVESYPVRPEYFKIIKNE